MSYTVDWPDAEYHRVLPRLYLGGHAWEVDGRSKDGRHSKLSEDVTWDYVVSAYLDPDHPQSFPMCDTRFVFFNDTEDGLDKPTWDKIRSAVWSVVQRWEDGEKVMIRCQAGYNRSGMLMCLVLMRLGFTAEDAIKITRKARGKDVLVNSAFEGYVREREEEYRRPEKLAQTKKAGGM